jgi:hypothetical protein
MIITQKEKEMSGARGFLLGMIVGKVIVGLIRYGKMMSGRIKDKIVMADDVERIVRWIVKNVDELVVPDDEGNGDALVYNLVHLAREGKIYRRYAYEADQDEEIAQGFDLV